MSGTKRAAQTFADFRDSYLGGKVFRVHFVLPGRKQEVDPCFLKHARVGVQGARIVCQIIRIVELGGIDEDRDDRALSEGPCHADDFKVPLVQRAHSRHER